MIIIIIVMVNAIRIIVNIIIIMFEPLIVQSLEDHM